jgi:hypothetical protein
LDLALARGGKMEGQAYKKENPAHIHYPLNPQALTLGPVNTNLIDTAGTIFSSSKAE